MASPLLETKLHVPRRRRGLVSRPRLDERLTRGAESALTLVSAPAGFGKTTLLAEWLAAAPADGPSVAWLSLDQRDNDPALFWTYGAGDGPGCAARRAGHPARPAHRGRSALARHVRSVIARLDNAEQEIAKIAHRRHGRLRFGSRPTALATFVPRALTRFQQREPDVSLTVIDDHLQRLLPRLHDGQLDLSPRAPAVGPHSVSPAWVSPVRMR